MLICRGRELRYYYLLRRFHTRFFITQRPLTHTVPVVIVNATCDQFTHIILTRLDILVVFHTLCYSAQSVSDVLACRHTSVPKIDCQSELHYILLVFPTLPHI